MKGTMKITVLAFVAVFQLSSALEGAQDLTSAFKFAKNMDDAYAQAKAQSKPIMVICHKSTCPACKDLRPALTLSAEVQKLSKKFILVESLDKANQDAEDIGDVNYIPRIYFIKPNKEVLYSITNPEDEGDYPYYYQNARKVHHSMTQALGQCSGGSNISGGSNVSGGSYVSGGSTSYSSSGGSRSYSSSSSTGGTTGYTKKVVYRQYN